MRLISAFSLHSLLAPLSNFLYAHTSTENSWGTWLAKNLRGRTFRTSMTSFLSAAAASSTLASLRSLYKGLANTLISFLIIANLEMDDEADIPSFSFDYFRNVCRSLLRVIIHLIHQLTWPSKDLLIIILLSLNIFFLTYYMCAKLDQNLPQEFIQNLYKSHSCSFSSSLFAQWPLSEITWEKLIQKLNFTSN